MLKILFETWPLTRLRNRCMIMNVLLRTSNCIDCITVTFQPFCRTRAVGERLRWGKKNRCGSHRTHTHTHVGRVRRPCQMTCASPFTIAFVSLGAMARGKTRGRLRASQLSDLLPLVGRPHPHRLPPTTTPSHPEATLRSWLVYV